MTPPTPPTGYTTREAAAAALGCSLSKVQRLIERGALAVKREANGAGKGKTRVFVQVKSIEKVKEAMAVLKR